MVIAARNEAPTVAAVVQAARGARGVRRVVVVDDHSSDATSSEALAAGAEVILSRGRGSKALALATGVAVTDADVVVFFDGDILNATPAHFDQLASQLRDGGYAMCCGLVDYGTLRNRMFLRLPPITGLRAVRRDVFEAIPLSKLNGFQIEIMINEVVARGAMKSAICILDGTRHRSKIDKLGLLEGARAHVRMTLELLHCFTFVPLWTYRSYLQHLTVLKSDLSRQA